MQWPRLHNAHLNNNGSEVLVRWSRVRLPRGCPGFKSQSAHFPPVIGTVSPNVLQCRLIVVGQMRLTAIQRIDFNKKCKLWRVVCQWVLEDSWVSQKYGTVYFSECCLNLNWSWAIFRSKTGMLDYPNFNEKMLTLTEFIDSRDVSMHVKLRNGNPINALFARRRI